MKKIIIILIILAVGYFIYKNYYTYSPIEIKDWLIVTHHSSLDINSASVTPPPSFGHIEGTLENKGEKALTSILIIYSVGLDTLYAGVGFLLPGSMADFKTSSTRVRSASSDYSLIEVKYSEVEN